MFKVYSSSAGSGKTYTLTKEYLKLALHTSEVMYFKHILAVTFTNAAANEMKSRILSMLGEFAKIDNSVVEVHPMFHAIVSELYPQTLEDSELYAAARELISGRSKLLFYRILHRYSDFSVMTIDKFTKSLVSSFTDELGLPFVFETKIDADLLKDAVDRLLARIGQEGEDVLTEIVESYYHEKAEEGSSWGALPEAIRKSAEILLNEEAYLKMRKIADLSMEDWTQIRSQIRNFKKEKEAEIVSLANSAMVLLNQENLIDKDFFQGARGIYAYYYARSESFKLWDSPNSYCYKSVEEDKWYASKPSKITKEGIDSIKDELSTIFYKIDLIRENNFARIILFQSLDKHLYHLSLLGEIRKEFDGLLRQHNQVHISDFNRRISEIVANEPIPFIFERIGERYKHILLDEFQDTSKLQFANLLPLIENALGEGHFNLAVGDAKQSIYRFRGGDMDLILHLSQDEVMDLSNKLVNNKLLQERLRTVSANLVVDHLRTNRRSFAEITKFNNTLFEHISASLSVEYPMVGKVFDQYFQQEIPEGVKTGGHVQIDFCDTNKDRDSDETPDEVNDSILEKTLELIDAVRIEGYQWSDIAILCRSKKNAALIAEALNTRGVPLISDDALTLANTRSIGFLISILKVLQNSSDTLTRYEAMYLFHLEVCGSIPASSDFIEIKRVSELLSLDEFLKYFQAWNIELDAFRLRQLSLFELTETLIRSFSLNHESTENEYLFRFLDVILDFSNNKGNYLGDFLSFWETERFRTSIIVPEGTDALRITTIHKSKGLEYPVVLIPYASWNAMPPNQDQLWVDIEEGFEELKVDKGENSRYLNSSLVTVKQTLNDTAIVDQYQEHLVRTIVENLNLLYVAFTRPIQSLYIITNKSAGRNTGITVRNWLMDFMKAQDYPLSYSEEQDSYILFDKTASPIHAPIKSKPEKYILSRVLSSDPGKTLRLRRQAERIFDVDTFEIKYDIFQRACYLLTRLKSPNDISKTIDQMKTEGIVGSNDIQAIESIVINLISNPSLSPYFEKSIPANINKEVLIPGGKLYHVDRIVQLSDTSFALMRFIPLDKTKEPIRQMKKMVAAYQAAGKTATGLVTVIETGEVLIIS